MFAPVLWRPFGTNESMGTLLLKCGVLCLNLDANSFEARINSPHVLIVLLYLWIILTTVVVAVSHASRPAHAQPIISTWSKTSVHISLSWPRLVYHLMFMRKYQRRDSVMPIPMALLSLVCHATVIWLISQTIMAHKFYCSSKRSHISHFLLHSPDLWGRASWDWGTMRVQRRINLVPVEMHGLL